MCRDQYFRWKGGDGLIKVICLKEDSFMGGLGNKTQIFIYSSGISNVLIDQAIVQVGIYE